MIEQNDRCYGPYELSKEDAEGLRAHFGEFSVLGEVVYVCACHRDYEGDTCTTIGCLSVAATEDAGFEPIKVVRSA
jgi:hypothetical protein